MVQSVVKIVWLSEQAEDTLVKPYAEGMLAYEAEAIAA